MNADEHLSTEKPRDPIARTLIGKKLLKIIKSKLLSKKTTV